MYYREPNVSKIQPSIYVQDYQLYTNSWEMPERNSCDMSKQFMEDNGEFAGYVYLQQFVGDAWQKVMGDSRFREINVIHGRCLQQFMGDACTNSWEMPVPRTFVAAQWRSAPCNTRLLGVNPSRYTLRTCAMHATRTHELVIELRMRQ